MKRSRFAFAILLIALAWPAATMGADLPQPLPPAAPAPATPPLDTHVFAPPDAACLEWTDGCRTCQRPPAGEATCSNIGIACVAQTLRCTRR